MTSGESGELGLENSGGLLLTCASLVLPGGLIVTEEASLVANDREKRDADGDRRTGTADGSAYTCGTRAVVAGGLYANGLRGDTKVIENSSTFFVLDL